MRLSEHPRRWVVVALSAAVALLLGMWTVASADVGSDGSSGHKNASSTAEPVATTEADWQEVAQALGRPGTLTSDGLVYRVIFPRRDLTVTSYGVTIKPELTVFSYAAFSRYSDGTVAMMGDLVTTEPEQPVVTDALQAVGLEQTAVHKHLLAHDPDLWWNHFHGSGTDPVEMAATFRNALDKTNTPPPAPCPDSGELNLDTAALDTELGATGVNDCGVYKFLFKRNETVTDSHGVLAPGMGVTTAINFQPTGDGQAAVNGDYAMTADEVQDIIQALRTEDIRIVELHQHGLYDQPRLFYMHFWAVGDAATLAKALGAAMRAQNVSPVG